MPKPILLQALPKGVKRSSKNELRLEPRLGLAGKDNGNLDPARSSLTPSDAAFTTTQPERG